jgi:hypothetical protein
MDYEQQRKLQKFKDSRKVGVKGTAICARLQSDHLSLMDLQNTVLKQQAQER